MSLFENLNYFQKIYFLNHYLNNPSNLSKEDLKNILNSFPFDNSNHGENLNFLAIQLFRKLKEELDLESFAKKLKIDTMTAKEILNEKGFEVYFPIAKDGKADLNKLFVIPLSSNQILSTESVDFNSLEVVKKLIGKGFFITFSKNFDFKTNSYTLALYSILKFGDLVSNYAFTGILTSEGEVDSVEYLEEKIKVCRENKIPIIFPEKNNMKSIEDLEKFFTNLEIPIFILPSLGNNKWENKTAKETFLSKFKFSPNYIKIVFHINTELNYTNTFNEENIVDSFKNYSSWLKNLCSELKIVKDKYSKNLLVCLTSNPLVFSFFAGIIFSKKRLSVRFYKYFKEGKVYKPVYTIRDDRDIPDIDKIKNFVKIAIEGENTIVITSKGRESSKEIVIKIPSGNTLDKYSKELAFCVNTLIRSLEDKCYDLILETSNDFAFALGYFLEDYKCINLIHKGNFVYSTGSPIKKPYYLTNAFSLNMLNDKKIHIDVEEIDLEEAKEKLEKNGFISYISHESTAQVLKNLLKIEVKANRKNLKLKKGDKLIVFQLSVRPKEGQIFSKEEIEKIVDEKNYKFFEVLVS